MTLKKKTKLAELGYHYVCMWEHDFNVMRHLPEVSKFLSSLDLQARLDPRESFFGGRTNCTKLHYEASEGESIKYVDFCR